MKEYYDVMNTIKGFTAEDATVIVGSVMDESMGDSLRVTMVATGLNGTVARRQAKPELKVMTTVRDGTTNQPVFIASEDEAPAVFSSNNRRQQVEAMKNSGVEEYDIPAFLRRQAD
jgi:cell division protein FtsZ